MQKSKSFFFLGCQKVSKMFMHQCISQINVSVLRFSSYDYSIAEEDILT